MCPQYFQKYEQEYSYFSSHRNSRPDTGYPDRIFRVLSHSLQTDTGILIPKPHPSVEAMTDYIYLIWRYKLRYSYPYTPKREINKNKHNFISMPWKANEAK